MGKSIEVVLGKESFSKKEDVEVRIRTLIKSYQVMDFIIGADKELCLNLFKNHPNYMEKFEPGIEAIQVRLDEYGNRNFHLHRIDGTDEVISWKKSLTSIKSS